MSNNRWQRIENIFHQAAELAPAARPALLDEVCAGDESLRQEVESLLALDAGNGSTFVSLVDSAADDPVITVEDLSGRVIGPYKILERIGAGGMGVVYQARDTQLDRTVAIKVLPADRMADADRKRRFIQEAKAASALNHPNIVTIHTITHEGGADCIVMEYVTGKTLGESIPKEGLPPKEALRIAIEIADAMAVAHAAGIVHRDLKPSNVMVTESGRVKVLDFGLAKLVEAGETLETLPRTMTGQLVGTPAYMSPEQAQGLKVDARSDIFAFGCVFYEMVTGRRAFHAESTLATLAAILHEEPVPIEGAAPEVTKLIGRCLRKDPSRRCQNMDELKRALEELKEEAASGKLAQPAAGPLAKERRLTPVMAAGVILAVAAGAGLALWLRRSPTPPIQAPLMRLTSDYGLTTDPALSPDGKLLAYASDRSGEGNLDIYVKQVGGGEAIRLTRDPADDRGPAFSPDGTMIAFRSEREGGGIYIVPAWGGPARRIAPKGWRPQFSPDGNWIAYSVGGEYFFGTRGDCRIYVVPSGGGEPRQLRSDFAAAMDPVWAPDGNHLLFLGNRDEKLSREGEEGVDWWVTPLDSGPAIETGALDATRDANLSGPVQVYRWMLRAPAWEPQGHALVFSAQSGDSTNLWRIGISSKTWKVTGTPQRLTSGPTREESPSVASASASMVRLAFASVTENSDIWSLPIDLNQGKVTGAPTRLTQDTTADFHPDLSADGNRMAWVSARSGNQEIWIRDLRSGEDSALTASRTDKWEPRFSPDSSRVSFSSYENKKWTIYVIPAAGGTPEKVCEDCGEANAWSPDGKQMIGNRLEGQSWVLDVASRRKSDLLATGQRTVPGDVSPDSRWFTFWASYRMNVAPFDGERPIRESAWIPIMDGARGVYRWSPDGNLLYAFSDRDGFSCIWAQRVDAATKRPVGVPFAVFHSHDVRISLSNQATEGLAIGNNQMLFNLGERTGNIWMAEWKER